MSKQEFKIGQKLFVVSPKHRGPPDETFSTISKIGKQYLYLNDTTHAWMAAKIHIDTLREWVAPNSSGHYAAQCYVTEEEYRTKMAKASATADLLKFVGGWNWKPHPILTVEDLQDILKFLKEGKQ